MRPPICSLQTHSSPIYFDSAVLIVRVVSCASLLCWSVFFKKNSFCFRLGVKLGTFAMSWLAGVNSVKPKNNKETKQTKNKKLGTCLVCVFFFNKIHPSSFVVVIASAAQVSHVRFTRNGNGASTEATFEWAQFRIVND